MEEASKEKFNFSKTRRININTWILETYDEILSHLGKSQDI